MIKPEQSPEKSKTIPSQAFKTSKFFKFMTPIEKVLFVTGLLAAIIAGAVFPALAIMLGRLVNAFNPELNTIDSMVGTIRTLCI